MKVNELIQRVQSIYSKGAASDNSRLSNRHIYSKLVSSRSRLLEQKLNKRQKISQWNYMDLSCVELMPAMKHECACIPQIGCELLVSRYKIPKPITSTISHTIQYVTSNDGIIKYDETTWTAIRNKKGNKYTSKNPEFFIKDGYLYITHKTGAKILTISLLAHNPEEVWDFPSYCDDCKECSICYDIEEKEFPIDEDDVDTLVDMAYKELIGPFMQAREDLSNDAKDSPDQTSK